VERKNLSMSDLEYHVPVLRDAVLGALRPAPGERAIDLTLGGGGHARAMGERLGPQGTLIGLDQDPDAIEQAARTLAGLECKVLVVRCNFAQFDGGLRSLGIASPAEEPGGGVDVMLADLGVSSHQLDTSSRGFSFSQDGPLDMRMSKEGPDALALILDTTPHELARILREGGEVPNAMRIALALKTEAAAGRLQRTSQLAALCERLMPPRHKGKGKKIHPATTVFQALRIAVNQELEVLDTLLERAKQWMRPGGRLGIISFHSLEDRRVKQAFKKMEGYCICPPKLPICCCGWTSLGESASKRPIVASDKELEENPRARSAKLRVFRFL